MGKLIAAVCAVGLSVWLMLLGVEPALSLFMALPAFAAGLFIEEWARKAPKATYTRLRGVAFFPLIFCGLAAVVQRDSVPSEAGLKALLVAAFVVSLGVIVAASWKLARLPECSD